MVDQLGRVKVFLSYAHEDEPLKNQLDIHLSLLKRLAVIETWSDQEIVAGHDWEPTLWAEFEAADVILLLISANFLASDFCYREEMGRALERHDRGQTRVIPILIRACDWEGAPFGRLQVLPKRAEPVTSWPNHDEAWTNVAKGISGAIGYQQTKVAGVPEEVGSPPPDTAVPSMSLAVGAQSMFFGLRTFQLEVLAPTVPEQGYVGWQTQLHTDSLQHRERDLGEEFLWPDAEMVVALRSSLPQGGSSDLLQHGVLSGLIPPLLQSHYVGPLLRIQLQCPHTGATKSHNHEVHLLPSSKANTNGSGFLNVDGTTPLETTGQVDIPGIGNTDVSASIDITCAL